MTIVEMMLQIAADCRRRAADLMNYQVAAPIPWQEAAEMVVVLATKYGAEALDLTSASAESGYTPGHLRRLLGLENGYAAIIPNAGTPQQPRILRCHLPRKPGHGVVPSATVATVASEGESTIGDSGLPKQEAELPRDPVAPRPRVMSSYRLHAARAVAAAGGEHG